MRTADLARLERKLGYEFSDRSHLELALTHRSCGIQNNERLEFLGDSIVNFVIAKELYERFPQAREGQLSRLRALMVRGVTLAEIGREFELGDFLHLGSGELKSGGFRRDSILADAVEAVIGAIYLDAGMAICHEKISSWFNNRLKNLTTEDQQNKDPKTRLQEYLQARQKALPKYRVTNISGEAHDQVFTIVCSLDCLSEPSSGKGSSRRGAEQQAARNALKQLGVEFVNEL